MAIPAVTCYADIEYAYSAIPVTPVQLNADATNTPTGWTWTILSVPPGSTANVGDKGDFHDGVAVIQNPTLLITAAVDGTYVIQCVAVNGDGPSDPEIDRENGQQCIVVRTEALDLHIPDKYEFNWSAYLNETLRALETAASTGTTETLNEIYLNGDGTTPQLVTLTSGCGGVVIQDSIGGIGSTLPLFGVYGPGGTNKYLRVKGDGHTYLRNNLLLDSTIAHEIKIEDTTGWAVGTNLTISAGKGGSTGGDGGALQINGGDSPANESTASYLMLSGGTGGGAGFAGLVGGASTDYSGGTVEIYGGNSTNSSAGNIRIDTGLGQFGAGGSLYIGKENATTIFLGKTATSANALSIWAQVGFSANSRITSDIIFEGSLFKSLYIAVPLNPEAGKDLYIKAGAGYQTSGDYAGGTLYLRGGANHGTGAYGNVVLADTGGNVGVAGTPTERFQVTYNDVVATQAVGFLLTNTTAATDPASEQYSPMLVQRGQAWSHTLGQNKQIEFATQVETIEGTTGLATGRLHWYYRYDAGSWVDIAFMTAAGLLSVSDLAISTFAEGSVPYIKQQAIGEPPGMLDEDSSYFSYNATLHRLYTGSLGVKSHAAFTGSNCIELTAAVQTTDDTETTLWSLTLADTTAYWLEATVVARDTTGAACMVQRVIVQAHREGGAAVLGDAYVAYMDPNTSTWVVDWDTNTNDVRLRITGAAATTINWAATIKYQAVSSNA